VVVTDQGREAAVSFWRYYLQPEGADWPDTAILGTLAQRLHSLDPPPMTLADYQPLRSVGAAITETTRPQVVGSTDRDWLLARVADLRSAYLQLDFPLGRGFIHGDIYTGNLLWNFAYRQGTGRPHRRWLAHGLPLISQRMSSRIWSGSFM